MGFLVVNALTLKGRPADRSCRDQKNVNRKDVRCQWIAACRAIKFATCCSLNADGRPKRPPIGVESICRTGNEVWRSADENAKLRAGDSAGLARHCAAQALTLERSRKVGRRATGPQQAKKFHDTSPCKISTRSGRRGLDEGSPFDDADIVIAFRRISGKSEVGSMKSDISSWRMSLPEMKSQVLTASWKRIKRRHAPYA